MGLLKAALVLIFSLVTSVVTFVVALALFVLGVTALMSPEDRADPFGGGGGIFLTGAFLGIVEGAVAGLFACRFMYSLLHGPKANGSKLA